MASQKNVKCSFCGRDQQDINVLVSGLDGHICDHCTEQAHQVVKQEIKAKGSKSHFALNLIKPADIKKHLDEFVIGQDDAKKILSVGFITITKEYCKSQNARLLKMILR